MMLKGQPSTVLMRCKRINTVNDIRYVEKSVVTRLYKLIEHLIGASDDDFVLRICFRLTLKLGQLVQT